MVSEVNSVSVAPSNESESKETSLRRVRKLRTAGGRARANYSAEQVNFIREAFLLDDRGIPWILERVHPPSSASALWRIAIGRAYAEVPLSPRLQAAVDEENAARDESVRRLQDKREAPADVAEQLLGGVELDDEGGGEESGGDDPEDEWA